MNLEGMVAKLFPGEDPSSTQFLVHFPRHWSGVPLRFPSTPLHYHRFGVPKVILFLVRNVVSQNEVPFNFLVKFA